MEEPEMETLTPHVAEAIDALKGRATVPGTGLPRLIVEAQLELAVLSDYALSKRVADAVVQIALRAGPGATPRKVMEELLERLAITADTWHGELGPKLRRLLVQNGHGDVLGVPATVEYVKCCNCGRDTTGDLVWQW